MAVPSNLPLSSSQNQQLPHLHHRLREIPHPHRSIPPVSPHRRRGQRVSRQSLIGRQNPHLPLQILKKLNIQPVRRHIIQIRRYLIQPTMQRTLSFQKSRKLWVQRRISLINCIVKEIKAFGEGAARSNSDGVGAWESHHVSQRQASLFESLFKEPNVGCRKWHVVGNVCSMWNQWVATAARDRVGELTGDGDAVPSCKG